MATTTQPTATLEHLALSAVKIHPDNVRTDIGDVTDLAASITEQGILEPLIVAPPHEGMAPRALGKATYVLIAGHRRLAAAKLAKVKTIPCLVRTDLATRDAQIEAMLVENLHRVDLTPVEEGDAYQLLLTFPGVTQKDLAAKVGQPVTRIRERVKVAKFSQPIRAKLQDHQVTLSDAIALAEFDDRPDLQKDLLKDVGASHWQGLVAQARRMKQADESWKKSKAALDAAGVPIIDRPSDYWNSALTSVLRMPSNQSVEKAIAWEAKNHADCPGRAAWRDHDGEPTFGCTTPRKHSAPKDKKSPAQLKAEAQAKEQLQARTEQLAIAATVRLAHIRGLVAQPSTWRDPRPFLTATILEQSGIDVHYSWNFSRARATILCEVLDIPVPEERKKVDVDQEVTAYADSVMPALAKLSVEQLTVLANISSMFVDEARLRDTGQYVPYDYAEDWIEALTESGFAWSDYERAKFTWASSDEKGSYAATVDGRSYDEPETTQAGDDA